MSYKLCTACNHSGVVHQMKEEYLQTWVPGSKTEVIKYTCPFCGKVEGKINTHGEPITDSQKNLLCSTLLELDSSLVEVGGGTIAPSRSIFPAVNQ